MNEDTGLPMSCIENKNTGTLEQSFLTQEKWMHLRLTPNELDFDEVYIKDFITRYSVSDVPLVTRWVIAYEEGATPHYHCTLGIGPKRS